MTTEGWQEPQPTIDQVRRLVERIGSYIRSSKIMSTISTIILIVLMLQLGILMFTNFYLPIMGGLPIILPEWFYYVMMLTFLFSMVVYAITGTINARLNRYISEYRRIGVIVQLRCENCNRTSERIWQKDDYVFKKEGKCACGGDQYIAQTYIMPLPFKKALPEE